MQEAARDLEIVIPENNLTQKRPDIHDYSIDIFVRGDDRKSKFDFFCDEGVEEVYLPKTLNVSTRPLKADLRDMKESRFKEAEAVGFNDLFK